MRILLFSILLLFLGSCLKPPDYPDEPVITYKGMTRKSMKQGLGPEDSTTIFLDYTDGNGDLGRPPGDTTRDVIIIDTRDGSSIGNSVSLPFVPLPGANNGISGSMIIKLTTTCCYFKDGTIPCTRSTRNPTDTLIYKIQVRDRAGNISKPVFSEPLILRCD
jgi:hypothetical protein